MKVRLALGALAALAVVVALIIATGGDEPYRLRVPLANATGLKSGSPVVLGGVARGDVSLHLGSDDQVIAELRIDRRYAPVGRDARVAITASNFLGQKRVALTKGDVSRPAPSGYTIPASQVTTPTDLDQVLDVLDADTRTRAKILLNEAGGAVVGRRVDISTLLEQFPLGLHDGTRVLRQLRVDNHTLGDLVQRSDRFVAEAASRRTDLARLVDVLGRATGNIADRRTELRATLARAPRTLGSLQRFLAELEATTKPLGPAAREISATAPPLASTLAQVEPFGTAAEPTLREATTVAPDLTHLADKAEPVLRRAAPTVSSLNGLAHALPGVTSTLNRSSDNILAVLENWSRAIQFRDALGHVFRGEASFSPDLLLSMIRRLAPAAAKRQARSRSGKPVVDAPRLETPTAPAVKVPSATQLLDQLPGDVAPVVKRLLDKVPAGGSAQTGDRGENSTARLLDYLFKP